MLDFSAHFAGIRRFAGIWRARPTDRNSAWTVIETGDRENSRFAALRRDKNRTRFLQLVNAARVSFATANSSAHYSPMRARYKNADLLLPGSLGADGRAGRNMHET